MPYTPHPRRLSSPFAWLLAAALSVGVLGCPDDDESKCDEQPEACDPPINEGDGGTDGGTPDSGTPDSGSPDGGSPDSGTPDASIDPATSIVLRSVDTFYTRNGVEPRPRNFASSPAMLYLHDGGTPITGTVLEPGRVRFDVPPGTYLVKNSNTQYLLFSQRSLDISGRRYGRAYRGDVFFQSPTPASLDLTGLASTTDPFFPYFSELSFHSLDVEESGHLMLPQGLKEGQTTVATTEAEYLSDYGNVPQFNAAAGDSAWVVQTVTRDAGVELDGGSPRGYDSLVRAAHLNPFAYDGGTFSVQAALQPAPQQTLRFDWRRDEFSALRSASATSSFTSGRVDVFPAYKTAQDGWIDYSVNMMLQFLPRTNEAQTPLVKELSYGNPYPASWEPMVQFTNTYGYNVTNHDGSITLRVTESFVTTEAASTLATTPVRPRISLPRDFQVDGVAATTPRILSSATPLVTWEAPSTGTVVGYTLLISRYNAEFSGTQTVARVYTGPGERSVRLPAGLLTAGNDYVLRLTTHAAPGVTAPERVWFTLTVPYSSATTSSALLRVQ
ncbi:hypothetical protein [Hyalangium gracile]|uniref:hypothetical protein n=1 Tax=Hyalangium gracile TaxID=394092 RepID=UPI001CCEAFC9|nr:hypothetical protein [Hyalangium gracile]